MALKVGVDEIYLKRLEDVVTAGEGVIDPNRGGTRQGNLFKLEAALRAVNVERRRLLFEVHPDDPT